ncbi:hypothetical protein QJQ45_022819 [Haematococcus lacustris]|nr:hypothetical protein QJQ45_022819 [Haematococcus lacustris]
MVPWEQSQPTNLSTRPPRPPTPYALTPTGKCRARHIFIDTRGLYGLMSDAGMLGVLTEAGVTSEDKLMNGAIPDPARPGHYIEGPANSKVASRWDALLPDPRRQKLASPKHRFDQVVHTDGVAISVMFLRPKPAAPPAELPRMSKGMGAVNPLAHLHAEWLGVDPGKTNMATVAHEERSADGSVVSVRHWTLTAGQYYRDSSITRQTQATKIWLATVKTHLTGLSQVSSKPSSLASYRRFADTVLETYDAMWAEVSKPRWANASFRLYCGKKRVVASFWVKVRPKEAVKQFRPERVVLVDEFRTSRVSSADNTPSETLLDTLPESFRFYDRDVSAALNIRRCAVGPGPRPTELCYWTNRPAMPKPGQPGQEWVEIADKPLLQPKPAAPPAELPRMSKGMGAVNPLAHLHAEWLGVDPGKTNMATVAHEERSADGSVVSVRHWTLTAGQYYRDSSITRQTQATKIWLATVKTHLTGLSQVSSKPSSLASYRRFADTVLETYDAMWAEVSKPRWANASFRLYCGKKRVVASFWVKVRPKEAVKQFRPERVVLVDEFRTSRVSSADNTPSETLLDTLPESFRFYDRDVSAALNIRRCAVGPGPRPTELCYWTNRPAMPKPGQPGQEWVEIADKPLLLKWQRKLQQ